MQVRQLEITGAVEFTPKTFPDSRGLFTAPFQEPVFAEALGHPLRVAQTNHSVSARNVIRGVHFADVPPGQAKYVTCVSGAVLDVVVDIRVGSPTFGRSDTVLLDDVNRQAVYISEGLGHAFMSLADGSAVTYLCSTSYAPGREHGINPLDPELGIDWPDTDRTGRPITVTLSDKDRAAPSLAEAARTGLLPAYEDVRSYHRSLAS